MTAIARPLCLVLHRRDEVLAGIVDGEDLRRTFALLCVAMIAGSSAYGAVLGMWRSPLLALYVALKMPLLLLVTSALTMLFNWIVASLLGVPLRIAQVAVLTFLTLAVAAVILGSLAPVAWLFTIGTPPPSADARLTHNALTLVHTALVGGAGLAGTVSLWRTLARVCGDRAKAVRVYVAWLAAFALVGGEVAWLLRPFIGSVYLEVAFLRSESFQRNVYEFLLSDVLPALFGR